MTILTNGSECYPTAINISDVIVVFVGLKFDNKPIQHILRRHERKYNLKTTKE